MKCTNQIKNVTKKPFSSFIGRSEISGRKVVFADGGGGGKANIMEKPIRYSEDLKNKFRVGMGSVRPPPPRIRR